jgi:hypothetical protein
MDLQLKNRKENRWIFVNEMTSNKKLVFLFEQVKQAGAGVGEGDNRGIETLKRWTVPAAKFSAEWTKLAKSGYTLCE